MGAQGKTTRNESISLAVTKQEKEMSKQLRRHYGFTSDRELVVALLKRAFLNINTKS